MRAYRVGNSRVILFMRYEAVKHDVQIELAKWIERLRNDQTVVYALPDWMHEHDIRGAKQILEAAKFIMVAHCSLSFPGKGKFCGITNYFTKFKVVSIVQKGFSFTIKIQKRPAFWTNKRLQGSGNYKVLRT